MQGLQQSYSQYFNLRHRKVGHVFQGRYQAIVCQRDEYLLELLRYIHLNPVRAGLAEEPKAYPHCGHQAYAHGKANEIIEPGKILAMLGGKAGYLNFIRDGMSGGHKEEFYEVEDQRFLGPEGFGEKMREAEEDPGPRKLKPIEATIKKLAQQMGISETELRGADRSWKTSHVRTMIAYAMVRQQGYKLKEVARYLRREPATVGTLVGRLAYRMAQDDELRRHVERLAT